MPLAIQDLSLHAGQWVEAVVEKDAIFLHHTAGGHRPDWTVHGWNVDRTESGGRRRVATAYVIGGRPTLTHDEAWDGAVIRCFPDEHWAYHLSVRSPGDLERRSIGIELCNYGWLTRSTDGRFYSYVHKPVPDDQVTELDEPFRGHLFYHRYTDRQLESLGELLRQLSDRHGIDLRKGLRERVAMEDLSMPEGLDVLERQRWLNRHRFVGENGLPLAEDGRPGPQTRWAEESVGRSAFEYDSLAYRGSPGVWTHANVRKDKTDCAPQSDMLALIASL